MADGAIAGQLVDHGAVGEAVADEAGAPLLMEMGSVEGDDAGALLAAVLERMQAEDGEGGGVGVAEHAENPAFLAELVVVEGQRGQGVGHGTFRPRTGQVLSGKATIRYAPIAPSLVAGRGGTLSIGIVLDELIDRTALAGAVRGVGRRRHGAIRSGIL